MTEPRTFASLGPTLLARKGGARPAMRPQLGIFGGGSAAQAVSLEDLGWNDMGHEVEPGPQPVPAPRPPADVVTLTPAAPAPAPEQPEPPVREHLRAIAEHMERQQAAPRSESRAVVRIPAVQQGRRAAFTLRLDAERHLRLRLASTLQNRSAQQLVTEALDRLLADVEGLETLAAQVKRG